MTDLIRLAGFRVVASCGVLPEEKARRQPFELDVDVAMDLRGAGATDDLAQTLDYGSLCDAIAKLVDEESWDLLERFAERVAQLVLADGRVTEVGVEVRKLRPPVAHDLRSSGVRVVRARS
ncbi:MAG: dihydroneopterin aldolase [Acidimicrobiales bacterium]|nr:dihydroneopterin aldolase [Acidimicrobiales bacterium]